MLLCLWLALKTRNLTGFMGQPVDVNVCERMGLDLLKYFSSSAIMVAILRIIPGIVGSEIHLV